MNGLLEKIIANWLDSSSERAYQVPFCFLLIADGHRIIHSTRHNALELGKDIITTDSSGIVCAFQLKGNPGRNLTISQWQSINGQIQDLVAGDIPHPSVKKAKKFRPFLVTNGQIEEDVCRAIGDYNKTFKKRYKRTLEVMCRGDLLEMAKRISLTLWPSELQDTFTFLQLFTQNGKDPLDKDKFSRFLEDVFFLNSTEKKPGIDLAKRRITSGALICALALTPFTKENNHSSVISGWITYIACISAFATRWNLSEKIYQPSLDLAKTSILDATSNMLLEFNENKKFIEGDLITDKLYQIDSVRATYLCAYISILGLHQSLNGGPPLINEDVLKNLFTLCFSKITIWGESAIPLHLIIFWYWKNISATQEPQTFLTNIFKTLVETNLPDSKNPLLPPYYEAQDLIREYLLEENSEITDYSFAGASYTLEALLLLLVRYNWKQTVKMYWPDVTRITFRSFEPKEKWRYFLWRSELGTNIHQVPIIPCSWEQLKEKATKKYSSKISKIFIKNPVLFMIFISSYSHRISTDTVLYLDDVLNK